MLDGALFDSFAEVYALNGSIASENPVDLAIVSLVEAEAKSLFTKLDTLMHEKKLDHLDLMRFSCLSAATGANGMSNLTDVVWLHSIHPPSYFPSLSLSDSTQNEDTSMGSKSPAPLPATPSQARPKYKIAYQILAHDIKSLANLRLLIQKLDTPDSIILVHIDIKSTKLRKAIEELLEIRKINKQRNNVFLQKVCFGVIWGHISVVFAQLQGFYELLDLADWEYVINLSVFYSFLSYCIHLNRHTTGLCGVPLTYTIL